MIIKLHCQGNKKVAVINWDSEISYDEAKRLTKSGVTAFIESARETPFNKDWATKLGVKLYSPPPFASDSVAELGILYWLLYNRFAFVQLKGKLRCLPKLGNELTKKRAVIIGGNGSIGKSLAKKLSGLGVIVNGYDVTDYDHHKELLPSWLGEADAVFLCYPKLHNEGSFNRDLINKLKTKTVLINLSRPELVKTPDILHGLRKGFLAHYFLDAAAPQGLQNNPSVTALGHYGAHTVEAREKQKLWVKKCLEQEGVLSGFRLIK